MLTFEQIKELMELMSERELQGLEVERQGFRLKIEGQAPPEPRGAVATPAREGAQAAEAPGQPREAAPTEAGEEAEEVDEELPAGTHVLRSPIVGTFYSSSSPDADSYVEVGGRVKKGQVLCIVEAMKLMNEIESDVDGEVLEVFPKNAQPVEFDEPLFAIKPD